MRAARAARLFFLPRPIKFLICGVVVAVAVVDAKGLAKLANIVAETVIAGDANVSQFSGAVNMCCGNKFCCLEKKMFLPGVKNIFASRTQILRPKHMFPNLATPGNRTRKIVSAKMFPSLARP